MGRKRKDKYLLNLTVSKIESKYIPYSDRIGILKFSLFEHKKIKTLLQVEAGFSNKARLSKYLKDINKIYQEGISVNIKTL